MDVDKLLEQLERASDKSDLEAALALLDKVKVTFSPQEAISFYKRALNTVRKATNSHLEAIVLINLGLVYSSEDQAQEALKLYEQALPLMREVGDRAGAATTLNEMAAVY